MKKINKKISTLLFVFICSFCLFLVSCGKSKTAEYTFVTNGAAEIGSVEITVGEEYTLPTPTREGYSFEGWYASRDYSGEAIVTVVAAEDQSFYAKWEKLCAIELNLDGGTLSATTLYLKAGENVYDFMKDYVPEKSGFVFGAWYDGDSELMKNTRITADGITLTAKYKVGYTVEIYEQNLALDGYEKADEITGYDYVGNECVAERKVTGFTQVENENTVSSITLSANASQNVLKLYFDRNRYTVTYNSNYPVADAEKESVSVAAVYGQEVEVPYDCFSIDGYCLVGWATSTSGEIAYAVNYIDSLVVNKSEETSATADKFTPERNTALYAVWIKAYTNMFGGEDYIYLFDDSAKDVYLCRGGLYFKGEYRSSRKTFEFLASNEDILLEGKLNADGTFCYYESERAETSYTLYNLTDGTQDESVKIYFDNYNGIKYSVQGEGGTTSDSEGSYSIDENGYYTVTFESGELAGETIVLTIGTVNSANVFVQRNENEVALGSLVRFVVYNSGLTYYQSAYMLTLNGFGIAKYNTGSSDSYYYYAMDGDAITLTNSGGATVGVARLMEHNGVKGYMFYNSTLDQTYTSESGATLILDGLCEGTYKNGTVEVSGYYQSLGASVFGGTIVQFDTASKQYIFLVTKTERNVSSGVTNGEEGDGEIITQTVYTFEEKQSGYAEYYYQNAEGAYYAPLLVLNADKEGEAIVYGYTSSRTYEKVSRGSYVYDENTKLYIYTAEEYYEADVLTTVVDLSEVKSFVYNVDTENTSYHVNYWYSMTNKEDDTVEYSEKYLSEKGETLTLVAGFAIYSGEGYLLTGTYAVNDGIMTITTVSGNLFLEVDAENKSFIRLNSAPYTAYVLAENGSAAENESVSFDGKGGATYTVTDGENVTKYVGTVSDTGRITDFGYNVYRFVSDGKTFDYLQLTTSSSIFVCIYNQTYNGEYVSEDGILKLDGYGFIAEYIAADGTVYNGYYFLSAENVVCIVIDGEYRYFDLAAERAFTARGTEYGSYLLMDNQAILDGYVALDGYNGLTVYAYDEDAEEYAAVDEEGVYRKNGNTFTLVYRAGNEEITLIGKLDTYTYSSNTYNVFVVCHEEIVRTYVNEADWSVLKLDDTGNVVKYGATGEKENGSYVLITEKLFYYVNEEGSDAYIYKYDTVKGTVSPSNYTARGYYTTDLESLLFTRYGFAIFNGTERLYYSVENGNVTIYHQDAQNAQANEYGFVAEKFGSFDDVKEYGGKTYYVNEGFALNFKRDEATADKYPVLQSGEGEDVKYYSLDTLVFTPSGGVEFTVSGQVMINGKAYSCYVTRVADEEGNYSMSLKVGYMIFDIKVTYHGTEGNSYEVLGMRYERSLPSANYAYLYYIVYYYYGPAYASRLENTYGTLTIVYEYTEDGVKAAEEDIKRYINGSFGESSGMYDADGNIVSIDKAEFTVTSSGAYIVEFVAEDGYAYRLYFTINSKYGGYQVYAFTRLEELKTADGYEFTVERVVTSDGYYDAGAYISFSMKKNGVDVEADRIIMLDGQIYYIVRTTDEAGKITSTVYYKVNFTEKTGSGEIGEEAENVLIPYETVTIVPVAMNTVYTADGASYVDYDESGILLFCLDGTVYLVTECSYDEATSTYTVKTSADKTFTVVIRDGAATIAEVTQTDEVEKEQ